MSDKKLREISENEYLKTFNLSVEKYKTKEPLLLTNKIKDDNDIALSTKLNRINSIISLNLHKRITFKDNIVLSKIKVIRDELKHENKLKLEKNNLTVNQEKIMNNISHKDLVNLKNNLNQIKNESNENLKHYLIVSMLILFPVRNDFKSLKIIKHEKDNNDNNENYILINKDKCEIILNYYKTSDTYKTIKLDLTELKDDILKYINQNKHNIYLFEYNNKPLSTSRFSFEVSHIFNKYLKYKITTTVLRKINLSDKYSKIIELMKKDNLIYGNSLLMRINTYINNNNNNKINEKK